MKPICAMCGRPTSPFVLIGREAIGPKCARKMGFGTKRKASGRITYVGRPDPQPKGPQTLDLFADYDPPAP